MSYFLILCRDERNWVLALTDVMFAQKKAESPSSRAIPQKYYYQKRYCRPFETIVRPVSAIFNRADISSSNISVLGCPPSIVATKGELMKFAKYMPGRKVKIKV
jgi:hypothetical protein